MAATVMRAVNAGRSLLLLVENRRLERMLADRGYRVRCGSRQPPVSDSAVIERYGYALDQLTSHAGVMDGAISLRCSIDRRETESVWAWKRLWVDPRVDEIWGSKGSREKLRMIQLPSRLRIIGAAVFEGCTALKVVRLPCALRILAPGAFRGCSGLESAFLGSANGLTRINASLFEECKKLSSVVLPKALRSIEKYAFKQCVKLEGIELPSSLAEIGPYAFQEAGLKKLCAPSSLRVIGAGAFMKCSSLSGVTGSFGAAMSIANDAFDECRALKDVTLPEGMEPHKVLRRFKPAGS